MSKIIDMHADTIWVIHEQKKKQHDVLLKQSSLQIDIEKLKKGDYMAQCFALFVPFSSANPFSECMAMMDTFDDEITKNQDIAVAYTYEDVIAHAKHDKLSAILTIEDGGVCEKSLDKLHQFYTRGVRMICLNWNYENNVGHPNYGKLIDGKPDYITPNTHQGLTDFGKAMIKEMNLLGMIIDVSHQSDAGFYDCIRLSTKPIVASHSNARSVCNHVRNLTDDMIIALAKNGGVMGMNFCHAFLDDNHTQGRNTISATIKHMLYIKNLVSVDVIALGSDFDGIDPNIEMKDASYMPALVQAMKNASFTTQEIDQITHLNFLRVFKAQMN